MIAFLARTWPNFQYPLLMMAFCVFLIVGTFWLYLRPDFGVVAALRRRPGMIGLGLLVMAGAVAILYIVE